MNVKIYVFGDNKSIENSASTPYDKLHNCYTALSFHCAREAVVAKIIGFCFIDEESRK